MKPAKYVLLDPTGNRTALVTEWGGREDEKEITRRLMEKSEQVAYLEAAGLPGAAARLRLMGGEFCGNASMAAAGWLVRGELAGGAERTVPLEVSGAAGIVACRIRGKENGFEGTVGMPGVLGTWKTECRGIPLEAVRMEGILHLVREGREPLEKEEAEALLREAAGRVPDEAVGLLDRNLETGYMRPLVFVRGSGTTVWETACGSGSAAIGALEALRKGTGSTVTPVPQPGGTIRAEARAENGRVTEITITGFVPLGEETEERILETEGL